MNLDTFEHQIFFATIRISRTTPGDQRTHVGTGFLVRLSPQQGRIAPLLVSNRHVFGNPATDQLVAHFHLAKPDENKPDLGKIHAAKGEYQQIFFGHPDPDVDLACLNISPVIAEAPGLYCRNVGRDMLMDVDSHELPPGKEVVFIGYPEGRYDTAHNLPILRRGYIATIPSIDYQGKKQFLIDAQVWPGSSGSPVFAGIGGRWRLIGVLSEVTMRHSALQTGPAATALGVQQVTGLGLVLKASCLKELLDHVTGVIEDAQPAAGPEPATEEPTQDSQ